ncbi:uncharacterized protein BX664DRAFT_316537 [Halteromyces radiatus]|uniref:uncharacterized protein n=1 Tax=Halteromyces radiatus TaxID=101107 RepID=UPI00221E9E26|nr:uncharacterized protein BX664DRAFT_316537 [Halteromyces radiatus]KAI8085038.1 hypothetical protein BX664DRAFT_316537 [Halteromyces radiatus]
MVSLYNDVATACKEVLNYILIYSSQQYQDKPCTNEMNASFDSLSIDCIRQWKAFIDESLDNRIRVFVVPVEKYLAPGLVTMAQCVTLTQEQVSFTRSYTRVDPSNIMEIDDVTALFKTKHQGKKSVQDTEDDIFHSMTKTLHNNNAENEIELHQVNDCPADNHCSLFTTRHTQNQLLSLIGGQKSIWFYDGDSGREYEKERQVENGYQFRALSYVSTSIALFAKMDKVQEVEDQNAAMNIVMIGYERLVFHQTLKQFEKSTSYPGGLKM